VRRRPPGVPIFYCPANQTIYSSAGSIADYGETVRLAGYWIAFHEYAHHVQRRIDVLAAAYTRTRTSCRSAAGSSCRRTASWP
jgi:predicted metalloprotease